MANACIKRINCIIKRKDGQTAEEHINFVRKIFVSLLTDVLKTANFKGKEIKIPSYGESDEMESFFKHIIHYDETDKTICYDRLTHCCILPNMLKECCLESECTHVRLKDNPKYAKQFTLYCALYSYVAILEERENYYLLVTAFYVTPKKAKKYL